MDYSDLLLQQDKLQKEGNEVLEKLQLLQFLSKYGKPIIAGSLAIGLMTWRDIDIEVEANSDLEQDIFETTKYFFKDNNTKTILLQNNVGYRIRDIIPNGMYVGVQYQYNKEIWKIDIWFISEIQHTGKDDIEWFKKNVNEDNKKSILLIKNQMAIHPKYRKTIFSQDIYDAVLKEKVTSYDGFVEFLKTKGKIL